MGKGSNTTTTSNAPSAAAAGMYNQAWNAATSAASNPYQYYPGQMVAGLTPQQLSGMSEVNNATGIANPYINAASTLTSSATQPIGASQINQYMNPYISDVASTTAAEINQNNQIQQNQLQGNAAALGALGGNRVGVAQAQLANQQDLAENQQMANIYQGGYNTALGAAQTTNAQQLQGASLYGSLGTEAQNTALAGANAQMAAGSAAQTQQQNQLNAAYSQWAGAQQYPFQTAQYLANTAEGIGSLEGGTGTSTAPASSMFSSLAGLGMSTVGILGGTGAFGANGWLKTGGRVKERAMGGVASYDGGGGVIPYENDEAPDPVSGNIGGYFPTIQSSGVHGEGPPKAPQPIQQQSAFQQGQSGEQTGKMLGDLIQAFNTPIFGSSAGVGNSMGGGGSDSSIVAHQGGQGYASGGRTHRADGGSTGLPSSGVSAQIEGSAPSEEEQMENYSMLASMMPGAQPPQYHYGQQQPTQEAGSQMEMASGGIARTKRASGGGTNNLPVFTPSGGQKMSAPQPTSTAGIQPTSWGNVQMPAAPQLSTAPVQQMTPADIQAAIALPTGGTQNNYAGYIESLPGSNPSTGNIAPGSKNTYGATTAPTTSSSDPSFLGIPLYSSDSSTGLKTGGRAHYDDGGDVGDFKVDGNATPVQSEPTGGPPGGWLALPGNPAPPITPVQSTPLPPPVASQGVAAVPPPSMATKSAPPIPAAQSPAAPQGVAAATPAPAAPAAPPQQTANDQYQPPINNPGNLRVPGSKTAFQQFKTPAAGMDAMADQLVLDNKPTADGGHGLSTLSDIIASYAPPTENDTASYLKNVSAKTGIAPDAKIDLSDPAILAKVQGAMIEQEGSKAPPGTQMAQNLTEQPAYVSGQVASDASPAYLNPTGATQGNAGIPAIGQNPYAGPQTQQENLANNPWMALATAGLATMAGTSPFAAVNIGQGGLAGMQYLQGIQAQQRQNAATQQAQAGVQQTGATQRLQAQQQQNAYTIGLINQIPSLSDAQRNALGYNNYAQQNGLPLQQIPGALPPGLPAEITGLVPSAAQQPVIPQNQNPTASQAPSPQPAPPPTTTGAVGGSSGVAPVSYNQQGQAVISPQFAQNATGLIPAAQSSIDTTTLGPNAQPMPYRSAFQQATSDLGSNYAPAQQQGQAWMNTYGPAAQQVAAKQLQDVATAGAAQSAQLDELQSEAQNIHTGPVTGPLLSSAVKTIQDVGGLFGIDTSGITDASNAAQVIPKLSTTLLAAAGKMASDQGGYEALRMMQSSVPTISNTGTGVQQIVQIYNTINQRAQALASYTNNVVTQGVGTVQMAASSFNQMYPPAMWASRVSPIPTPASVADMKPGYAYQSGGQQAIWTGNNWAPMQ